MIVLTGVGLSSAVSLLWWAVLYIASARVSGQGPEWCSRVVTLLHGTVASVVGMAQCGINNFDPCRFNMKVDMRHYALMSWTWGYFAFDLLWCVASRTESALMLVHHAAAILAVSRYMMKPNAGCTFACSLAMMEVTNPLLQLRWFLKSEGYDNNKIFFAVEAIYVSLFIFIRGILGSWVTYQVTKSDLFDLDEKFITVLFYVVSLGFLYNIFGFIRYKYKQKIARFSAALDELGIFRDQ